MKNNLEKWIVGTGFSRGIGAEISKKIKQQGYKICHIGRTKSDNDDEFIHWDLSIPFSAEILIKIRSILKGKGICGFLYGAGIIPELICEDNPEKRIKFWNSQSLAMQINYFSCIGLVAEVIPFLLETKENSNTSNSEVFLAHISSLSAVDPLPGFNLYGTTKLATLKYFEYLAQQYAFATLPCLAIHPGTVQTDMLDNILVQKEYKELPIVSVLKEAQQGNHIISPEKSAGLIVDFLFNASCKDTRKSAHGKLFVADSNQIW